jgi:hypothetical protein
VTGCIVPSHRVTEGLEVPVRVEVGRIIHGLQRAYVLIRMWGGGRGRYDGRGCVNTVSI